MPYKKYIIILIVLLCLILSISYLTPFNNIPLGMAVSSSQISRYTDVKSGLENLYKGNNKITLDMSKNDTCYWIIPGRDENGHFIEIREYGKEYGACLGIPRNTTYVRINKKLDMLSQGCVCNGTYVLEQSNGGLKISKQVSIQRRISLSISDWIQNLLKVFNKK